MCFVEVFFLVVALAAQLLRPSQGQQQLLQRLGQGVRRATRGQHPNVPQRGRQIQGQDAAWWWFNNGEINGEINRTAVKLMGNRGEWLGNVLDG